MAKKADPNKVIPQLARQAASKVDRLNSVYTFYVQGHYRATGSLASGADARDVIEWLRLNEPATYRKLGGK